MFFILCFCLLKVVSTNAQCGITLSYTPASCPTCCDGCVTVNVITGCPPYTISWYPSDPTFPVVCSACADTTYIATVTDNCACTSSDTITITGTTGITLNSLNNDFAVYPNPSDNLLFIKIEKTNDPVYLIMTDLYGNIVQKENLKGTESVIYTNQLATGIYFIIIRNDRQILRTEKWVKAP